MSYRHAFQFDYPVSKLIPICRDQAQHHRAREAHYRGEYALAEKALRENGIVMMESAAVYASGGVTGFGQYGKHMTPQVDPKFAERVSNAKDKIQEHVTVVAEYEKYLNCFRVALVREEAQLIALDADDVQFFGLNDDPPSRR